MPIASSAPNVRTTFESYGRWRKSGAKGFVEPSSAVQRRESAFAIRKSRSAATSSGSRVREDRPTRGHDDHRKLMNDDRHEPERSASSAAMARKARRFW